ncbi:MAG: hypothetical protein JXR60_12300 [Bacteroidales bacterium]|nr:hypothetical protein [Bacteroidales bacterium]
MANKIIKHKQNAVDACMLTYGKQEAFFKLHQDNEDLITEGNEIPIPAVFKTGDVISYDENDILFDRNIAKLRSLEPIELATGNDQANIISGSFNQSFNKSFK